MDAVWPYVAALAPTIVVAAFFYAIIKRIVEGDRRERMAQRRFENEQDAHRNAAEKSPEDPERPSDDA